MLRLLCWIAVPALATSLAALAPPDDKPGAAVGAWGQAVDPKGDCKIALDGEKLTIEVPGSLHDLSVEAGDVNAPRVLRPIEGDFIAQVKVAGAVVHNGNRTSDTYLPYHGAGLVIWVDGQTYLRLERAVTLRGNGEFIHYANFELRKDGQRAEGHEIEIPNEDTYLRIERRGDRVYGLASSDGVAWTSVAPIAVELPKDVKLGVAAVNTSTDPFKIEFLDREVYRREANAGPK